MKEQFRRRVDGRSPADLERLGLPKDHTAPEPRTYQDLLPPPEESSMVERVDRAALEQSAQAGNAAAKASLEQLAHRHSQQRALTTHDRAFLAEAMRTASDKAKKSTSENNNNN